MSDYKIEISSDNTITVGLPSTGNGVAGPRGEQGLSAYDIAKKNGYTGTEAEWLAYLKGEKGDKGDKGDTGATGPAGTNGKDGANGMDGKPGADGLSAYELAVKNGFSGNKAAWLESLKGEKGDTGVAGADGKNGLNGVDGKDGLSAYSIAVKNGYNGTEAEWVNKWLRGTIVSASTDSDGNMTFTDINGNVIKTPIQPLVDAANSAKAAATSESNAKTSETHAVSSETNAASYLAQAKTIKDEVESAVAKVTGAMKYAGSVNTYADLPTANRNPGDVYNVKTADASHNIKAGENVAWNGTDWDPLGGTVDLSPYATNTSVAGTLVNVTYSNATLTFVKKDGSKVSATVNNVAHATAADTATSATTAAKATADANGQNISDTYAKKTDIANAVNTGTLKVTGTATVPTLPTSNNTDNVATTEFVHALNNELLTDFGNLLQEKVNDIDTSYAAKAELNSLDSKKVDKSKLWEALHSQDAATLTGLTNAQWNALGLFIRYFSSTDNFENQPTQYGQLINIPATKGDESTQLWIEQSNGRIYARGVNASKPVKNEVFKQMAYFNADGHLVFPNGAEMWVD